VSEAEEGKVMRTGCVSRMWKKEAEELCPVDEY
jgi:hypothetical protein